MSTEAGFKKDFSDHQDEEKSPTDWILCYLVCPKDAAGAFTGGILLTDNRARPEHFAFVQPIKPTTMQRILYGSTLEEQVKIDVIAQKLWQGLPKPPDVLFVDSQDLMAARRIARVPTAFISKSADPQADSSSLSLLRYDAGEYPKDQTVVGEIIAALEHTCNLLEPFNRIREALREALKSGA